MSNPWMKFYPSDWRADPALRMCSLAARGLWMEMLCVMHEATPCGSLVINGRGLTPRQIAALAGASLTDAEAALSELEEAGVFGREADGTIYSRRMRRDVEKAERDRNNGKGGGNPALKSDPLKGVNPPENPRTEVEVIREDKAQKPEARSYIPDIPSPPSSKPLARKEEGGLDLFERFWKAFPRSPLSSEPKASNEFFKLSRADQLAAIAAVPGHIAASAKAKTTNPMNAATFLRDRIFANYAPQAAPGQALVTVERDSPAGEAWHAYELRVKAKPPPWSNGRWHFPSRFPPPLAEPANETRQ